MLKDANEGSPNSSGALFSDPQVGRLLQQHPPSPPLGTSFALLCLLLDVAGLYALHLHAA